YGNLALFLTLGNHVGLRGLGAEGIRTDGHRGLASSNRAVSPRKFERDTGRLEALTMTCSSPVSLRFHSLSSRKRAMVVACSRALRRPQERPADEIIGEFFGPARLKMSEIAL